MLDYSDLTYYKEGGNIFAGGYKVTDIVKYQGHQPEYDINMESLSSENQMGGGGGGGDKSMSNLGVPSGLFFLTGIYCNLFILPFTSLYCCNKHPMFQPLSKIFFDINISFKNTTCILSDI